MYAKSAAALATAALLSQCSPSTASDQFDVYSNAISGQTQQFIAAQDGSETKVLFPGVRTNSGGHYDVGTSTYKVGKPGTYIFASSVSFWSPGECYPILSFITRWPGNAEKRELAAGYKPSVQYVEYEPMILSATMIREMPVGATVEVTFYVNSGCSGAVAAPAGAKFAGARIQ